MNVFKNVLSIIFNLKPRLKDIMLQKTYKESAVKDINQIKTFLMENDMWNDEENKKDNLRSSKSF